MVRLFVFLLLSFFAPLSFAYYTEYYTYNAEALTACQTRLAEQPTPSGGYYYQCTDIPENSAYYLQFLNPSGGVYQNLGTFFYTTACPAGTTYNPATQTCVADNPCPEAGTRANFTVPVVHESASGTFTNQNIVNHYEPVQDKYCVYSRVGLAPSDCSIMVDVAPAYVQQQYGSVEHGNSTICTLTYEATGNYVNVLPSNESSETYPPTAVKDTLTSSSTSSRTPTQMTTNPDNSVTETWSENSETITDDGEAVNRYYAGFRTTAWDGHVSNTTTDISRTTNPDNSVTETVTTTQTETNTAITSTDIDATSTTTRTVPESTTTTTTTTTTSYDSNNQPTSTDQTTTTTTSTGDQPNVNGQPGTSSDPGNYPTSENQPPSSGECEGVDCPTAFTGSGPGDFYQPGQKTFDSVITAFNTAVQQAPISQAVTSVFTVSISASQCPTWSTPAISEGWFSLPAITIDAQCSSIMADVWPIIQAVLLAVATYLAIRVAFL